MRGSAPSGGEKALRIIAKSLFRELKQNGYNSKQIVSLSSELLALVTLDLRADADPSCQQS
jgi:hypothetical protein